MLRVVGLEAQMRVVSGLEAIMPLHPTAQMRWASNKTLQIGVVPGEECRERAERRPDEHRLRQRGRRERQELRLLAVFQLQAEARPRLVAHDLLGQAVGRALLVAAVGAAR